MNPSTVSTLAPLLRRVSIAALAVVAAAPLSACVTRTVYVVDDSRADQTVVPQQQVAVQSDPGPVVAYEDDAGISDPYDFVQPLSAYGTWVQYPGYGLVWRPSVGVVGASFRPYSHGHWEYTEWGWTWVDHHPFGWATGHYGRWFYDARQGWLWVPGTTWGPAWVTWRNGGGYVGWAAMPPGSYYGSNYAVYETSWLFVSTGNFGATYVGTYIVTGSRYRSCYTSTRPYRTTTVVYGRDVYRGPDYDDVSRRGRVIHRPIRETERDRPVTRPPSGTVAGRDRDRDTGRDSRDRDRDRDDGRTGSVGRDRDDDTVAGRDRDRNNGNGNGRDGNNGNNSGVRDRDGSDRDRGNGNDRNGNNGRDRNNGNAGNNGVDGRAVGREDPRGAGRDDGVAGAMQDDRVRAPDVIGGNRGRDRTPVGDDDGFNNGGRDRGSDRDDDGSSNGNGGGRGVGRGNDRAPTPISPRPDFDVDGGNQRLREDRPEKPLLDDPSRFPGANRGVGRGSATTNRRDLGRPSVGPTPSSRTSIGSSRGQPGRSVSPAPASGGSSRSVAPSSGSNGSTSKSKSKSNSKSNGKSSSGKSKSTSSKSRSRG